MPLQLSVPLIVSVRSLPPPPVRAIVLAPAPLSKRMPPMVALESKVTFEPEDALKMARSPAALGTFPGDQLPVVFQLRLELPVQVRLVCPRDTPATLRSSTPSHGRRNAQNEVEHRRCKIAQRTNHAARPATLRH